jgi:hypothetical protein
MTKPADTTPEMLRDIASSPYNTSPERDAYIKRVFGRTKTAEERRAEEWMAGGDLDECDRIESRKPWLFTCEMDG